METKRRFDIVIPVSDKAAEQTLRLILAEMREHTTLLKQIAADVRSLWQQDDKAPASFKINEHQL